MSNLLRNVLAVLAGLVVGAVVNGALITLSPMIIPPPPGVDLNNPESLKSSIHLFEARHFIMPFLAHALGSLIGALVAYVIAGSYRMHIAIAIGVIFLCGGVAASFMIPAPTWYIALDLLLAYLPMAYLGSKLGARMKQGNTVARNSEA